MTNILRTLYALFIAITTIDAANLPENGPRQHNLKLAFWQKLYANHTPPIPFLDMCKNMADLTELEICENYKEMGYSSFWQPDPDEQKKMVGYLYNGFNAHTSKEAISSFKNALEHAYDDLSYTVANLCLAEAYLQNNDYLDALVLYRSFEKYAKPIVRFYGKKFRAILKNPECAEAWKSKNPHLVKKLESAEKLYKHELEK